MDDKDEARISILKEMYGTNETNESDPNLVIPLHKPDDSQSGSDKKETLIIRNRLPGYDSLVVLIRMHYVQSKDEYFHQMIDALPEECDVHSDSYRQVKIEDFGKAVLRGMGWDGKNNVDPSVYVRRLKAL